MTVSVLAPPATVTFATPSAGGGQAPVTVACAPASGSSFPLGPTTVTCTATDAASQTASCSFTIAVTKAAQLQRTRLLAFGDSITAGEVTAPVTTSLSTTMAIVPLVLVPSAAYPTVLTQQLKAQYPLQAGAIVVANYGKPGERAADARTRFIQALNTENPEAVLLMEGYNDIPGGADGAASAAANEIRAMAQEARLRGMRVFIATLAPGRPGGSKTIDAFLIYDYNTRMRSAAASEGAVLVDVYNALLPGVNTYIGIDGLHPNETGYAKIAETFFNSIRAALETP